MGRKELGTLLRGENEGGRERERVGEITEDGRPERG